MTAITPTEVFDFCGCKTDIRHAKTTMMTDLIIRTTEELETTIGRKIETTTFSSVIFQHGINCEIYGQKLFLKGIYRDIYSITSITEEGTSLSAVTSYNDGNDYYYDSNSGIIYRKFRNWSMQEFAIAISGKLGLCNTTTNLTRQDVKNVLVEMCAAKSGLWKTNVRTENGNIETIRTDLSEDTLNKIKILKIKSI